MEIRSFFLWRFFLPAFVLALAACLLQARPVAAETVSFVGKSYCPMKYEIAWP